LGLYIMCYGESVGFASSPKADSRYGTGDSDQTGEEDCAEALYRSKILFPQIGEAFLCAE